MKRPLLYCKLIWVLMRLSVMARLGYRLNGLMLILTIGARFASAILFIEIVFSKTNVVGDWTKSQVFLFYGVFMFVDSIFEIFFGHSMKRISEYIEDGDLDLMITKPINTLFLVSFTEFRLFAFANVVFSTLIVGYAFQSLSLSLDFLTTLSFVVLIILGLITYYSLHIVLATLAFWTIRTPFTELLDTLGGVMRFPLDIFGKNWQFFFTFFVPMIFIVTVPTKVLLGLTDKLAFISPLVAILLFFVATKFWGFALKRYSSASS